MSLRLINQSYNSENLLYESLVTEALDIHGDDFYYIPRTFVGKDEILGEDRISEFKNSYSIVMYLETVDGYDGQGAMLSKFGLQMDQQATLTVARRNWVKAVGQYGQTTLPNRPAEGDLIYYPRTNALLEIMFVNSESPFYQLGQLYVYKLTVEKFRYSSEKLSTGIEAIDKFNSISTDSSHPNVDQPLSFGDNNKFQQKKADVVWDANNPFGDV